MEGSWTAPIWTIQNAAETDVVFASRFAEEGHTRLQRTHWPTDETLLDCVAPELLVMWKGGAAAVAAVGGALVLVRIEDGVLFAQVAGDSRDVVEDAVAVLRTLFPASEPVEGKVPVTFWTYGPHGPQAFVRKVDVAPWGAIVGNYASATRGTLDRMMGGFEPSHGGQLILWQGEPGTGKTHALRALAWEWRGWAALHYVVDPDKLFGEQADYLIQVLLADDSFDVASEADGGRWKVLVLEDTGELLAADAKDRTGQGLSRLLNTVDGLIGQGLRILVLVTTNEELKRLHPAVQRPGRCALRLTFEPLDRLEAAEWLRERGVPGNGGLITPADGQTSLAELYALAEGYAEKPRERAVGFAV